MQLTSIIIPCYNAENYVAEAIHSALNQTHQDCEIIVVDDGSSDASLDKIKSFGDNIRWVTGPNRGGCSARNRGMELARGSYIQFLDADDIIHPGRIQILLKALCSDPSAQFAWAPNLKFEGNEVPQCLKSDYSTLSVDFHASGSPLEAAYAPSASLFRIEFLKQVGPWDESLRRWVDLEYHARIARECAVFVKVDLPLYGYRQHSGPQISKANRSHEGFESALQSLTLTHKVLLESSIPRAETDACLFPFYVQLARSAANNGDQIAFRSCLNRAEELSAKRTFKFKSKLTKLCAHILGLGLTTKIIESRLPAIK